MTQPGTLLYMSPEQLRSMAVTTQSDLFSLGLVLFRALCRHPPVRRPERTPRHRQILYQPPLVAKDQDPELPADLDALLAALWKKDIEKRPASAGVVAAELRRVLRGLSDAPDRPSTQRARGAEAAAYQTLPAPTRQADSHDCEAAVALTARRRRNRRGGGTDPIRVGRSPLVELPWRRTADRRF